MLESKRRMGPSVTATISGTTPLFVYAGAILFLAEALVARGFAGTLAIAGGVAVLAWRAPRLMGGYATWILLIPAAAALIRAIAQLLTKYSLLLWPNVFVAIVIGYTLSTAVVWGLVWIKRERIPRHRTLAFIVLSGCCNAIGVLAMFAAFRVGEATVVAPIVATSPLFTLLASTMITRDEMLTWRMCLGVCLIVAGAGLIVSR
jgi:drug/metabolite transporter (DMT)-like permease